MNVLLISTYELGRQPFGLASPGAWLRAAGADVAFLDLSVQRLEADAVSRADVVGFYLPMHTATRIAVNAVRRVRELNPAAYLCAFGLYAPTNADLLQDLGIRTLVGGEFEQGLVDLIAGLERSRKVSSLHTPGYTGDPERDEPMGARTGRRPTERRAHGGAGRGGGRLGGEVSLARQQFLVPDRSGLPPLADYAYLRDAEGERRTVGYTEASRGCKHLCRHCPVVPVYRGRFRVVQHDVVLEDIRRQVESGASHVTFGDPDFFNGPGHAVRIVRALHRRHPDLTYDVTIKVGHLLEHADLLPVLRDTGCAFVTSAVESIDDRVLSLLDKGHTRADFFAVVDLVREAGLVLQPTLVPFTPWIDLAGYRDLLRTLAELDLVDNVAPVQLSIRLLIPAGSLLLELPEVRDLAGTFDSVALTHPWVHPDVRVDRLQQQVAALVETADPDSSRRGTFAAAWQLAEQAAELPPTVPPVTPGRARATIPYLSEPWYC